MVGDGPEPLNRNPLDVSYPRAILVALGVATAIALLVAASTSGAAFGAFNPAWDGSSDLEALVATTSAESELVLNTTTYGQVPANTTLAVVLSPDRRYSHRDASRLRRFVHRGGTLVVAEDFGDHSNGLLEALNATMRFNGSIVRDERYNSRSPAMPIARNVSTHPFLTEVDQLTLNHGTVIEPHDASVIVRTSGFAYLDANRNGRPDGGETLQSYPVVTRERIGRGEVVAVSDPSLFINAMLDRPGNREFVTNAFGAHRLVLLDHSHAEQLPPLSLALVIVRRSPLVQLFLSSLGLLAIVVWERGWVPSRFHREDDPETTPDGDRIEVLTTILRRERPGDGDRRNQRETTRLFNGRNKQDEDE